MDDTRLIKKIATVLSPKGDQSKYWIGQAKQIILWVRRHDKSHVKAIEKRVNAVDRRIRAIEIRLEAEAKRLLRKKGIID